MYDKTSPKISAVLSASCLLAAIAVSLARSRLQPQGPTKASGQRGSAIASITFTRPMVRLGSPRQQRRRTLRSTVFWAGCRQMRSEDRVTHSCPASEFLASHATYRLAHARTSTAMFSDGRTTCVRVQ